MPATKKKTSSSGLQQTKRREAMERQAASAWKSLLKDPFFLTAKDTVDTNKYVQVQKVGLIIQVGMRKRL